jgi:chromosome segregation ATPase
VFKYTYQAQYKLIKFADGGGSLRLGRPTTGADIGELQQKISQAEKELSQLKLELDQTKQQAKQAEVYAQESGRTNRKLKTEIQTLTDMSNRKDRQAENSKATAFFFEGQVKKYMDEIETARQGMGHLKELDDQLNQAKAEQAQLEKTSKEEALRVKATIKTMQDSHKENKENMKIQIDQAYAELEKASAHALQLQQEIQQKMEAEMQPGSDIQTLEREHRALEQKQMEAVKQVYEEVDLLRKKLEQSEASTLSHEESMVVVKEEMDRIMRRLRAIDQLSANNTTTATAATTTTS